MELRAYWNIIWRYIWIVALVVGVVGVYVGYQYYHLRKHPDAPTYHSNITIAIGLQATTKGLDSSYTDNLVVGEAKAEEFIASPILSSSEFDTEISQQIAADANQIAQRYSGNHDLGGCNSPGAIGGALTTSRAHSLVTITTSCGTAAGAWAVANAIGEVTVAHIGAYLHYVLPSTPSTSPDNRVQAALSAQVISAASSPTSVTASSSSKITTWAIMLLVALIIGLALTFLADYLDDRIHSKEEAGQLLQLPLYGQVPRAPTVGKNKFRSPA